MRRDTIWWMGRVPPPPPLLVLPKIPQVTKQCQILDNICLCVTQIVSHLFLFVSIFVFLSQFVFLYFCAISFCILLNLVLLTSPLFRMRVFMWHASNGRRRDTKNRFGWRRVWKVKKKLVESLLVKLEAFWKWRSVAGMWEMLATGAPPVLSGRGRPPTMRRGTIIRCYKSLVRFFGIFSLFTKFDFD